MHYELYIDVFFLVNFLMDYVLLLLTGKIARFRLRYLRIALGSGIGAALACVVVIFFRGNIWRLFVFHGVISFIMLKAGFEIKGKRMLVKAWILLYISALLMAGILNALHPYIRGGCFFVIAAFAGYHLCLRIWDFLVYLRRRQEGTCKVQLYLEGKMCEAYALIDTGNRLRDDLTGKPVHSLPGRLRESWGVRIWKRSGSLHIGVSGKRVAHCLFWCWIVCGWSVGRKKNGWKSHLRQSAKCKSCPVCTM